MKAEDTDRAVVANQVATVLESHGSRLVASLARRHRDIERASDAVQDAALKALEVWPVRGVPDRPAAWLFTVANHRMMDDYRTREVVVEEADTVVEAESDDQLALLFACCHPAIAPRNQVGLALRTLCGLSTESVARAFLESAEATGRRLSRASSKIRDAGIPFEVPGPRARPERLAAVLSSIYLLFNEGYAPTYDTAVVRPLVCEQAIDLGQRVASSMPDEPEVFGLVALMEVHHARRDGRVDANGDLVPLDQQDRSLWRHDEIEHGSCRLDAAFAMGRPGSFQIQAAIAVLHATAKTASETDWNQITALYGVLLTHVPSPVVELNAAVALAMSAGPLRGLQWLDRLTERNVLKGSHLLPAARADMLVELQRPLEAIEALDEALRWVSNPKERRWLEERRRRVSQPASAVQRRRRRRGGRVRRLRTEEWRAIRDLFPKSKRGRPSRPPRQRVDGVLWVLSTGAPWREVPARFGAWQSVYHSFRQWENDGRWAELCVRLGAIVGSS